MGRNEVLAVVANHMSASIEGLKADELDPNRSMKDYGLSSLDMVEIVSRSMRQLKVKVPRAELRKLTNINGLVDLLHASTQIVAVTPQVAPAAPQVAAA